jgi:hypothetical protein
MIEGNSIAGNTIIGNGRVGTIARICREIEEAGVTRGKVWAVD